MGKRKSGVFFGHKMAFDLARPLKRGKAVGSCESGLESSFSTIGQNHIRRLRWLNQLVVKVPTVEGLGHPSNGEAPEGSQLLELEEGLDCKEHRQEAADAALQDLPPVPAQGLLLSELLSF